MEKEYTNEILISNLFLEGLPTVASLYGHIFMEFIKFVREEYQVCRGEEAFLKKIKIKKWGRKGI